MTTRYW